MKLKMLTYNAAMLPSPFGSKKEERAEGIVNMLNASNYNIVCLQEVFDEDIRLYLKENLMAKYPYIVDKVSDHDFMNEDSGLFFASQFEILRHRFREYNAKKAFTADAFTDKGIFGTCLKMVDGEDEKALFVFNTHLQSTMAYHDTRVEQLMEARRFIHKILMSELCKTYDPLKRNAVLTGDFNVVGDGERHEDMLSLLGDPRDLYRERNRAARGYTWNSRDNRYLRDRNKNNRQMQRLDYIMVFGHAPYADNNSERKAENEMNDIVCSSCKMVIPKASGINGLPDGYDLSDHYGVEATITI